MRLAGLCFPALLVSCSFVLQAASPPQCSSGARAFLPCEIAYTWTAADLPSGATPYKDDLLRVEFRSPNHITYLMHAFDDGGHTLRVRFSPTEPGVWTTRITSSLSRFDGQESSFTVADSGLPGMVSVANLRHWRTTDKKPHLWLSAAIPFLEASSSDLEPWLDARKHDGFTHIRGALLTYATAAKPFTPDGQPNLAYFQALDVPVLSAASRGFTLDLLLADSSTLKSGALNDFDRHESLVRYLVARYGGLNVTWQGIEHFEETPNSRALLKDIGLLLAKYDGFSHPRSTDARDSSSPLLNDNWMNYLLEASPNPQLGAVEHQFTQQPEIHFIATTDPDAFRHQLWNCTANGEYPSVSYRSLGNEANVKAVRIWARVMSGTRHWEFEPYFNVDGARAVGLDEVEYLAYAEKPGIVEVTLPKHKYNPVWINPASGEEIDLKDYKGEVFSRQTPDNAHDWILQVPRDGQKESMLKYYYFESQEPPIQEVETDTLKIPFEVTDPKGPDLNSAVPPLYSVKITRANRGSRTLQFVWWGEIVSNGEGVRLLGLGSSGTLAVPPDWLKQAGSSLNLRVLAINANGKAYEVDEAYRLAP